MFMKKGLLHAITGWSLVLTLIFGSSCGSTKNATYFSGMQAGSIQSNTPFPESVIQKTDILSITVSDLNPDAAAIFSSTNAGSAASGGSTAPIGYLVNTEGSIQFPDDWQRKG